MRSFLIVSLLVCSVCEIIGQNLPDTSFIKSAFENSVTIHNKAIEGQDAFYNGSQYAEPAQTKDGDHPFFISDDWTFGSITFDGQFFENVPLLYDITNDYVVSESPSGDMYVVAGHYLSSFTLGDHYFEKLNSKEVTNFSSKPGYYEIVYNGPSKVISRHDKTTQRSYSDKKVIIHFIEKSQYFIRKNNTFHSVKSKSSVLKIFSDKKNLLRSYIRSEGLNFSRSRNESLAKIAAYYDQLNQAEK